MLNSYCGLTGSGAAGNLEINAVQQLTGENTSQQ
jgi:hypothetical protein